MCLVFLLFPNERISKTYPHSHLQVRVCLGRVCLATSRLLLKFLLIYWNNYVYNRVITGNSGVITLQSFIPHFALCPLLFGWCSITSYLLLITMVNSLLLKEFAWDSKVSKKLVFLEVKGEHFHLFITFQAQFIYRESAVHWCTVINAAGSSCKNIHRSQS